MAASEASDTKIQVPMAAIQDFCRRWQVKELALFGSVLREDFSADSDIDVLVTFAPENRRSLFDLVDMQDELAALLRRNVDLVTRGGLRNPYRRHEILTTRRVLYAAFGARCLLSLGHTASVARRSRLHPRRDSRGLSAGPPAAARGGTNNRDRRRGGEPGKRGV